MQPPFSERLWAPKQLPSGGGKAERSVFYIFFLTATNSDKCVHAHSTYAKFEESQIGLLLTPSNLGFEITLNTFEHGQTIDRETAGRGRKGR